MTLDEAIVHCEEVADYDCCNENQMKCANEHRQLAEWLRDYKELKSLPSAQPEPHDKRTETHACDLIDRQAVIEAVSKGCQECRGIFGMCEENILALPSAQPEIIRCKDCKNWRTSDHTCREHSLVSPMMAYEYCSRAERRTNE